MTDHNRHPGRRGGLCRTLLAISATLCLYGVTGAGVSVYVSPENLAERAPWVVEATVLETASGYDEQTGRLATYVTLGIDRSLRGEIDSSTVVIREHGGSFGSWVHESDATPGYRPGERVLAFLETAPDGSLRTSAMFFGKYSVSEDPATGRTWASRDLDGRGTIRRRPQEAPERLPVSDLRALVAATVPRPALVEHDRPGLTAGRTTRPRDVRPLRVPPEYDRLRWSEVGRETSLRPGTLEGRTGESALPQFELDDPTSVARFLPADLAAPTRWGQVDSGGWIVVDVDPSGNPLGDDAATIQQVERAMTAWTAVPESRIAIKTGQTDAVFTGQSPASVYNDRNIMLFDDPYGDISDPGSNCTGVLAIGGYWRTSSIASTVNGVDFHAAHQFYVIFNNNFECFLGDEDDLSEVAAHEIGHGLGLGHSSVPDAIMRSSAYRLRGPRLGDDDADAVHCFYPHRLTVTSPDGNESWQSGTIQEISWTSTLELGPDAGLVDLEYSVDDGVNWTPLALGQPNDGSYYWSVSAVSSTSARVRVSRSSRTGLSSAPFPDRCSEDRSDAAFEIVLHVPSAGVVPAGSAADGALVGRKTNWGGLEFEWGASCSSDAQDYAVYTGSLDALRSGIWDHEPIVCGTGGQKRSEMTYGSGDRYFLIAPLAVSGEGPVGRGAQDEWRPSSQLACEPRESATTCE